MLAAILAALIQSLPFPFLGPLDHPFRQHVPHPAQTESVVVRAILEHIGEPATPPRVAQARGPPEWYEDAGSASHWEDDSAMPGDPLAQPEPEYEFDQRGSW